MHTLESLTADLETLNIPSGATVLVHSSYKSLGEVAGGPATIVAALSNFFAPGLLVMPTHTWAVVNEEAPIFDVVHTPSNVGIIGETFRKMPGVIRALHPTHSLAARGEGAQDFARGEERSQTPTPLAGCYGKLYRADSYVMFLGCPLTKNTLIHSAEEWANAAVRTSDQPRALKIRTANGALLDAPSYRHVTPLGGGISANYDKLLAPMLARGIAWRAQVGGASVVVCKVGPMIDYTMALLAEHPDIFLDNNPIQ